MFDFRQHRPNAFATLLLLVLNCAVWAAEPVQPFHVEMLREPFSYVGQIDGEIDIWRSSFARNGTSIVSTKGDFARVWDTKTLEPATEPLAHVGLRFSRLTDDGKSVFTAGGTHVRFWDVATSRIRSMTKVAAEDVRFAEMSPDGMRFVTVGREDMNTMVLWRIGEVQPTARLTHGSSILSAEFDPTGTWIVTHESNSKSPFHVWTANTGLETYEAIPSDNNQSFQSAPYQAQFDPSGRRLVVPQLHGFTIVESATGKILANGQWHDDAQSDQVRFGANGSRIIARTSVGIEDGPVRVFDSVEVKSLKLFTQDFSGCVMSPSGRWAVCAPMKRVATDPPELWDIKTGKKVQNLARGKLKTGSRAQWSDDGSLVALNAALSVTQIWRVSGNGKGDTPIPFGTPFDCT